jgi:hypothetical protein
MMWLETCVERWRCGCRVVCLDGGLSRVELGRLVGVWDDLGVLEWWTWSSQEDFEFKCIVMVVVTGGSLSI